MRQSFAEVKPHAVVHTAALADIDYCQSHTFIVTTTGGYAPLSYVWKKDGDTVSTDAVYTIDPLAASHSGSYIVEILDDNGDVAISDPPAVLLVYTPAVPAAGLMGLSLLAAGLALAGLLTFRRRD